MKCPLQKKKISTSGGSRIFPRRAPTPNVAVLTYYFAIFFAENCMKMKEFGPRGCIPGTPLDPPISTWVHKKIGTRNNNSNNSLLVACQNVPIRSIHTDFVVILSLIDWKEIMWELLCTVVGTYLTYLSPTCQPYVFRWPPLDVSTVGVGIHNPPEYTYPLGIPTLPGIPTLQV